MAFPVTPAQPIALSRESNNVLSDTAQKLMYSPEYVRLVDAVRHKAYRVLNASLPDRYDPTTQGTLRAYVEIYKLLTGGKDLFDGST